MKRSSRHGFTLLELLLSLVLLGIVGAMVHRLLVEQLRISQGMGQRVALQQIGRASCRERVYVLV